ncbi:MAG TPA: polysaccharide biosynthesis C-terminal domain-containing protein, partial [Dysgonamonadaceae bacterium]|nr:polysaccharide biosynthesis C-terminal domain-containing protein [Dysgonamonadaceae bacterium]
LEAYKQLGIYSASMKIAIILIVMTQAFRYAFEPFIFAKSKDTANNKQAYAEVMKYFIIFGLFVVIAVMGYMDIVKYLIKSTYHAGLVVVPIVMLGELFFGIYFNLSLWYKLTDKTQWGAYMSLIGLVITLAINIVFIPTYGYMACAWASFVANMAMMLISYFMGQKFFKVNYDLKSAGFFFAMSLLMLAVILLEFVYIDQIWLRLTINTFLMIIYAYIALKRGFPVDVLKRISIVRKSIK